MTFEQISEQVRRLAFRHIKVFIHKNNTHHEK